MVSVGRPEQDHLRRRQEEIRERYERAYGTGGGLGEEFGGWEAQGVPPDE